MARRPRSKKEPSLGGDTIRAAQARREAAIALPDTLYTPRREFRKIADIAPVRDALNIVESIPSVDPVQAVRRVPDEKPVTPARDRNAVTLSGPDAVKRRKELGGCKKRPSNNKRSGNGAGRKFVPWC